MQREKIARHDDLVRQMKKISLNLDHEKSPSHHGFKMITPDSSEHHERDAKKVRHRGGWYPIHKGERGGTYIMVNGKKKYIKM